MWKVSCVFVTNVVAASLVGCAGLGLLGQGAWVRLKNDDILTATLLTEELSLKTDYGTVAVGRDQVRSIRVGAKIERWDWERRGPAPRMGGGGDLETDVVLLGNGDAITGVLTPEALDFRLPDGQELKIRKELIRRFERGGERPWR